GKALRGVKGERGGGYFFEKVYDVTKLEPVVAKPPSPDNRAFVSDIQGTKLDRAYIGSCTGGKMTDFRAAAQILKGKSVRIDTFVVPATSEIMAGLKREKVNGEKVGEGVLLGGGAEGPPASAGRLGARR